MHQGYPPLNPDDPFETTVTDMFMRSVTIGIQGTHSPFLNPPYFLANDLSAEKKLNAMGNLMETLEDTWTMQTTGQLYYRDNVDSYAVRMAILNALFMTVHKFYRSMAHVRLAQLPAEDRENFQLPHDFECYTCWLASLAREAHAAAAGVRFGAQGEDVEWDDAALDRLLAAIENPTMDLLPGDTDDEEIINEVIDLTDPKDKDS